MTREEVLKRINSKIVQLEWVLESLTEPTCSGVAAKAWKNDLDFYRSIRSFIEGIEAKGTK